MPLFKVGDYVERVETLVPEYMKFGRIVRITPHPGFPDDLTEYEVEFKFAVASYYQSHLRLIEGRPAGNQSSS